MRERPTVRLLLLDERERLFLFQYEDAVALDPTMPDLRVYWVTPGGGLEPGESYEQAGLRELWEETGLRLDALGPWVWQRERVFPEREGARIAIKTLFVDPRAASAAGPARPPAASATATRARAW